MEYWWQRSIANGFLAALTFVVVQSITGVHSTMPPWLIAGAYCGLGFSQGIRSK